MFNVQGVQGSGFSRRIGVRSHAEEISKRDGRVDLSWSGIGLDKKDFGPWGKSDPYLEIVSQPGGVRSVVVHRTEVIRRTLNPVWKPYSLSISELCKYVLCPSSSGVALH
jgi:hypothetical protein